MAAKSQVVTESHWRSATKGISYRVFASMFTTSMSFFMTGSVKTAALIGSAEVSVKVLLYWAHERLWSRIRWGRIHEHVVLDEPRSSAESGMPREAFGRSDEPRMNAVVGTAAPAARRDDRIELQRLT